MAKGSSRTVQARQRARRVKAEIDARRQEQERGIEEAQTEYFAAVLKGEDAQAAVREAEVEQSQAIASMSDRLGLRLETIAELCEISVGEVRRLKKDAPATSTQTLPPRREGTEVEQERTA